MDSAPSPHSSPDSNAAARETAGSPASAGSSRWRQALGALVVLLTLAVAFLWQKLEHIQTELARTSTDSVNASLEARASAKNAQETVRELTARLGVAESRLGEVSLQRGQLEELMQSLSRSRDENLIVDIESGLRLAQQQSQMLGSSEPLLAALKTAETRLKRVSQPRLVPVARAIARDMDKLKSARILDIGLASLSLDEVSRLVDEMPLAHDPPSAPVAASKSGPQGAMSTVLGWGERFWLEVKGLVRVSKLDTPDAAIVSPSQGFFARENLKLRLLNARLGLMSRQTTAAQADLKAAQQSMARFFDPNAKTVQIARERVTQVQAQLQSAELPRLDETFAALATAAGTAGK